MLRSVRSRVARVCLVATVLMAAPSSVARQAGKDGPTSTWSPETKAGDAIFADGFESGNTSMWSNGDTASECRTTLVMPAELAD